MPNTATGDQAQNAIARAEALVDKMGETANAARVSVAKTARTRGGSRSTAARRRSSKQSGSKQGGAVVERAEETVDQIGRQIGGYLAATGKRIRTAIAFAQEEAEDMIAEARDIHARRAR